MRDSTQTRQRENSEPTTVDRRSVLKGICATALAGPVAVTGVASAQSIEVIEIEESLFGGFEANGSLPVVDELFVFVHGWFGDSSVRSQARDVLDSIEAAGYTPDAAIAIEWPATNFWYPDAESDTEGVGAEIARLIEAFKDSGGDNVRLTGHSLGGRIVYWTATKTGPGYEVDTIGGMGAAANGSTVCSGGQWHSGIADNAGTVRNYHSHNDSTVGTAYGGIGDTALGTEGAPCDGAATYTDVDVTSSVGGHLAFLGDAQVGSDLASVIQNS